MKWFESTEWTLEDEDGKVLARVFWDTETQSYMWLNVQHDWGAYGYELSEIEIAKRDAEEDVRKWG